MPATQLSMPTACSPRTSTRAMTATRSATWPARSCSSTSRRHCGWKRKRAQAPCPQADVEAQCPCSRQAAAHEADGSDLDLDRATWTAPRELMKMDRDHIVPLNKPVLTFLRSAHQMRFGDYVFPGRTRSEPMSNMTMLEMLKDMSRSDITVHGFRATFR